MVYAKQQVLTPVAQPEPGHVLTILALGNNADAAAVVTDLAVSCGGFRDGPVLCVGGSAGADQETLQHYETVILPLLGGMLHNLGLELPPLYISMTNLGAASLQDRGIFISGFSMDIAFLIAALSAVLGVPTRPGLAASGHIASPHGEVRMVRNLPEKLRAAITSSFIETVIFPDPDADDSLCTLTPEEMSRISKVVLQAGDVIKMLPVRDVAGAVCAAFNESELVLAALKQDYFGKGSHAELSASYQRILSHDLPARYWQCLEEALYNRDGVIIDRLLQERVNHHLRIGIYPAGLGAGLYKLLSSVPAGIRDGSVHFPLLPPHSVMALIQSAAADDMDDVRRLLDAVSGDRFHNGAVDAATDAPVFRGTTPNKHLAALLDAIGPDTVYRKVGAAIDAARASFELDTVTAHSKQECLALVTTFYLHIIRRCGIEVGACDQDTLESETLDWLERTFARQGGLAAAYAEAQSGTRGRMKFLLDTLTESMKAEEEEKYRNMMFKKFLDGLDYDARVELVSAFMDLLAPHLPAEALASPPERFVQHAEVLLRTYIRASGNIVQLMRTL